MVRSMCGGWERVDKPARGKNEQNKQKGTKWVVLMAVALSMRHISGARDGVGER